MGTYRKRHNEKARRGFLAKTAALKKARQQQFYRHLEDGTEDGAEEIQEPEANPNVEVLQPMLKEEKAERKRKLEEQLNADQPELKMSRQKRKRMEKYIDHQLKRDEKKVLLEKLAQTKVDTLKLVQVKLLGLGKQTKRQQFAEALELERQGRASDKTRDILYETREVKEWDEDDSNDGSDDDDDDEDELAQFGDTPLAFTLTLTASSLFIDNRPKKFGGQSMGFGFANLPKIEKDPVKKKYNWRTKVAKEDAKRRKKEDDADFDSLSDEEENNEEEEEEEDEEDEEEDGEEANGDVEEDKEEDDEEDEDDEEGDDSEEDSEEEESEEEEEEEQPRLIQQKPKHSSAAEEFKQWAEHRIRVNEGRDKEEVRAAIPEEIRKQILERKVRDEDIDHSSDEEGYVPINKQMQRQAHFVNIERLEEVQEQRVGLPVYSEEARIMEAVYHHDTLVICGETGSGKTTQVPQFLYEAGFGNPDLTMYPGMIGITQPRRVAAVSMAKRVGNEMGNHGHRIGYQIRFDSTIKDEGTKDGTAMKFMTDGVLLREMMKDFLLTKYLAIVIDEAHERNINTDILIGMLSRVVKLRRQYHDKDPQAHKPLKLLIMSATLRVSDFSENKTLFSTPPPIIKVDARQYEVKVHFNKHTGFDYMEDAFNKVCKIHRKLPPGGILVFLTGQNEITHLVKRLRAEFPFKKELDNPGYDRDDVKVQLSKHTDAEAEDVDFAVDDAEQLPGVDHDDYQLDLEEEEGFDEELEPHQLPDDPLYVLPLYSLLPTNQQMKVFQAPPPGSRICIVATNVAETSLTIPGIRYVVDCGRAKERKYNDETGVQLFEIDWISKASADQRAGRAGRTGPGHCYRLFSLAIYEEYFPQFSEPEILRMPFESIVLQMKLMGIDHIANFPFPTPPDRPRLKRAEQLLTVLGALDAKTKQVTDLGKTMSMFPLSPRHAKILIVGNQLECLPYIIALVSAFSVGDPFIGEHELGIKENQQTENGDSDEDDSDDDDSHNNDERRKQLRLRYFNSRRTFSQLDPADMFVLLLAVCAYDHIPKELKDNFTKLHFLRGKLMDEIAKLRQQISHMVTMYTTNDIVDNSKQPLKLGVPLKPQVAAIKQMVALGYLDMVAIRSDCIDADIRLTNNTSILRVPYTPVVPVEEAQHVFIHPGSALAHLGKTPPQYLIYSSLNKSLTRKEMVRVTLKPLVEILGKLLANIGKNSPLITYSKPLGHPYAPKNISATKRECYVVPRFGASVGGLGVGWDLPVVKVIQVKKHGSWVLDKIVG